MASVGLLLLAGVVPGVAGRVSAAACVSPGTDYGTVTSTLNVPAAATYRIWSRIMVPNSSDKTYLLEVDGNTCYSVGGGTITANTWTWVDYKDGNTSSKVQQSLSAGNHTIKLIGNKPDVKVDRIVAVSDLTCTPTGSGDNCNVPSDTTPPTVVLTAPAEGAVVSGMVSLTATASDSVGVTKVEFYDNSSLLSTDTSSPYSASWNSAAGTNGQHLITARAYDAAGNIGSDSSTVTVLNGDTQAPTVPGSLQATALSHNSIKLTWSASTDNTGVTGYTITRNGVPLATVGAVTAYTDTGLLANTTYEYRVAAFDAAGNKSAQSSKVSAKTLKVDDSQAPSKPTGLSAVAAGSSQVNLSWQAATDNIGVSGYDVYRSSGNGRAKKVGSSATTSYGDTGLSADTEYTYYVVARDASGNSSPVSESVKVKTAAADVVISPVAPDAAAGTDPSGTNTKASGISKLQHIKGGITGKRSKKAVRYARVILSVNNNRHIYQATSDGQYAIFGLPPGRYNLTFQGNSYASKSVSVQVKDAPLVVNAVLQSR